MLRTSLDTVYDNLADSNSELSRSLYNAFLTVTVAKFKRYEFQKNQTLDNFNEQKQRVIDVTRKLKGQDMWTKPVAGEEFTYDQKDSFARKYTSFWDVFQQKEADEALASTAKAIMERNLIDGLSWSSEVPSFNPQLHRGKGQKQWGERNNRCSDVRASLCRLRPAEHLRSQSGPG